MEVRAAAEQVFATNDPAEARSLLTSIYVPHELRSRDGLPLNFKIRYLQSSRLTLGHVRYGADSEVLVPPMEHCYHLNVTLAGRTIASQGGSSVSTMPGGTAVMFGPERARAVRWSPDAVQYAVKIPRASLEGQLAALLGRPVDRPLRFALDVDLAGPQGQSLLAAIGHLRTELSRTGGLTESPLVRAQLESYVLSQLLFVVPSDHHELLQEVGQRVGRRHIRVALDYIDEHLAEPLAGPDIAKAASVSLRALQAGFQDDIGMSPMAYVRSRRLDRVHEELLADADGALINEVAARWGFFHFGRFAEQYRMRFGVLPSMTAREGRTRRSR